MYAVPPTVFEAPTLGRPVCLGELYDQRSGKFLGVQLYPQNKVREVVTNIRNTDLSVSLSTTHEDKASLLDINAKLSLDYFGGLAKVSGSASYLNDEKSNTNEYAYALALRMRLHEKRILFAEDELGSNVLSTALENYIATNLATHFVSSIVYGGNFIVNLVARKSELSKEQKIEGKLQVQFDKLKGFVSLDAEADVKAKGEFTHMDDKFDLVVHGDVALDKVPINPKDVLDTFPQAASFISDGGGVPISVTLQPIPPKLYKGGLVYALDTDFVDDVLKAFSMLEDLSSRFSVLQDGTKTVQEYVPELTRTTRIVAVAFTKQHNKLRHALGKFLQDYQRGKKPSPGTVFSSMAVLSSDITGSASHPDQQMEDDDTVKDSDITGDKVLEAATELYEKHLDPDLPKDDKMSDKYQPSLAALENELSRFQYFASNVQKVRGSLQPPATSPSTSGGTENLSSIQDICKAIGLQNEILLFVMIPLTADGSNPDLAIVQYLALLRKHAAYLTNHAYFLYAENLDTLERRLPNKKKFSTLKTPSVFSGTVDSDGYLTWAASESLAARGADVTLPLMVDFFGGSIDFSVYIDAVDSKDSFSIQFPIERSSLGTTGNTSSTFLRLSHRTGGRYLEFQAEPFSVLLGNDEIRLVDPQRRVIPHNERFVMTFVQDTFAEKWVLYLDDGEIASEQFDDDVVSRNADGRLRLDFLKGDKWWYGQVYEVEVCKRALTKAEIREQYVAKKNWFEGAGMKEGTNSAFAKEENFPGLADLFY